MAFLRRHAINTAHAVLDRETILVTLMTLNVILSAFSVWQATRASDEADGVSVQVRVLQATTTRDLSHLQTLVDHDLDVLRSYCASLIERDIAVATLVTGEPDMPGVVASDLTLRWLKPLLRGDVPNEPCPAVKPGVNGEERGYSVLRVQQAETGLDQALQTEGSVINLSAAAARLSSQERWLMAAGLIFTVALLGLIMIDVLSEGSKRPGRLGDRTVRRCQYVSLGVATFAAFSGGAVLAAKCDPLHLLGIAVVLALIVLARRKTVTPGPIRRLLTVRKPLRGEPHWWAEILGALTLVVFSATALSLSSFTVQERAARTLSEREHAVAQQLLQSAEQDALRDLAAVAQLARFDAELAAANQARPDDAEAIVERRNVVAERIETLQGWVGEQQARLTKGELKDDCAVKNSDVTQSADDLLVAGRDRPEAYAEYLYAAQQAARTCDILSALTRSEAVGWASRASDLTLALVILGLAGFLLALASDPDRSRPNARWLLWAGGLGMLLGAAVAVLVGVGAGSEPRLSRADRVAFAQEVAAERHAACDETAVSNLNQAIDRYDGYGPAFDARADHLFCLGSTMPPASALSSERHQGRESRRSSRIYGRPANSVPSRPTWRATWAGRSFSVDCGTSHRLSPIFMRACNSPAMQSTPWNRIPRRLRRSTTCDSMSPSCTPRLVSATLRWRPISVPCIVLNPRTTVLAAQYSARKYARKRHYGRWPTSNCSRTRPTRTATGKPSWARSILARRCGKGGVVQNSTSTPKNSKSPPSEKLQQKRPSSGITDPTTKWPGVWCERPASQRFMPDGT